MNLLLPSGNRNIPIVFCGEFAHMFVDETLLRCICQSRFSVYIIEMLTNLVVLYWFEYLRILGFEVMVTRQKNLPTQIPHVAMCANAHKLLYRNKNYCQQRWFHSHFRISLWGFETLKKNFMENKCVLFRHVVLY